MSGAIVEEEKEVDPLEFAEIVDLFESQFSAGWCDEVMALTKWTEKKEKLEELIQVNWFGNPIGFQQ